MRLFWIPILLCLGCMNTTPPTTEAPTRPIPKRDSVVSTIVNAEVIDSPPAPKRINDFVSNDSYTKWHVQPREKSNYLCEVSLHKDFIIHWFHGQCLYHYFTYSNPDTILQIWSYKTDCLLDMDFLEKSYGLKDYPKSRDGFAMYTLHNDTTLKVDYGYPEWVKKVNQVAGDSIFPTYYYLSQDL